MRISSLALITTALIIILAGSAYCQSELVGRDTSVIQVSRADFKSNLKTTDHSGYSITASVGLFGRVNVGFSEIQWSRYSGWQRPYWWYDFPTVATPAHRSQSGYIEVLPFKFGGRRASGSFGIGITAGTDAGAGQGKYHGYTATIYGNLHPMRFLSVNATYGQAMTFTRGPAADFLQTNFGGGLTLRPAGDLLLTVSALHSQVTSRTTTTVSFGLGLLIPQK